MTVYLAIKKHRNETCYCLVGRWQGGCERIETEDGFWYGFLGMNYLQVIHKINQPGKDILRNSMCKNMGSGKGKV